MLQFKIAAIWTIFFMFKIFKCIHSQGVRISTFSNISTFRGYSSSANQIYATIQNRHCRAIYLWNHKIFKGDHLLIFYLLVFKALLSVWCEELGRLLLLRHQKTRSPQENSKNQSPASPIPEAMNNIHLQSGSHAQMQMGMPQKMQRK